MEEKEADGIRRIIIIDNSSWWIFLSYIVGSKITVYLDILYFVDSDGCRRIREVGIWLDARRRKHS